MKTFEQLEAEFNEANRDPLHFIQFYEANSTHIDRLHDTDEEVKNFSSILRDNMGSVWPPVHSFPDVLN